MCAWSYTGGLFKPLRIYITPERGELKYKKYNNAFKPDTVYAVSTFKSPVSVPAYFLCGIFFVNAYLTKKNHETFSYGTFASISFQLPCAILHFLVLVVFLCIKGSLVV